MNHPPEAITTTALTLAMDAAALRHRAATANIANASVAGHVPMRVSFEAALIDALQAPRAARGLDAAALAHVRPQLQPALDADGGTATVRLDMEVAEMARNAVQYQALAQGLSRHLGILATAAGDGRR